MFYLILSPCALLLPLPPSRICLRVLSFAALGLVLHIACAVAPGGLVANWNYVAPFFGLAMIVFSVLLQLLWRQENERLAYMWGCLKYSRSDYVRRDFKGERRFSSVKQR
eukprot:2361910-Pleurochrysis_carterae.AAC.2